jgi:hypothetical protein
MRITGYDPNLEKVYRGTTKELILKKHFRRLKRPIVGTHT